MVLKTHLAIIIGMDVLVISCVEIMLLVCNCDLSDNNIFASYAMAMRFPVPALVYCIYFLLLSFPSKRVY